MLQIIIEAGCGWNIVSLSLIGLEQICKWRHKSHKVTAHRVDDPSPLLQLQVQIQQVCFHTCCICFLYLSLVLHHKRHNFQFLE